MLTYKIPRQMFELGSLAVYVSQRTSSDEWLKCGITSRASVAFRSCLNTQGHARAAADPRRQVLGGSWVPRRFAIISSSGIGIEELRELENGTRKKLKEYIAEKSELSLETQYLRNDYFRLPLGVVWAAIDRGLRNAKLNYKVFDIVLA